MTSATRKSLPKKSGRLAPLPVAEGLKRLKEHYGTAECALHHRNPFELLVATILSAQCTDERVNKVTPNLFARFPTPKAMAGASLEELEDLIRSTGFFKNKAKSLKGCAEMLMERHQGVVPKTLEELTALPGVGRKTANVVLGVAYGIAVGVVVDTHVGRLSRRFLWTREEAPEKVERDLMKLVPREDWIQVSHLLIHHGRQICQARKPQCLSCFLFDQCPRYGVK